MDGPCSVPVVAFLYKLSHIWGLAATTHAVQVELVPDMAPVARSRDEVGVQPVKDRSVAGEKPGGCRLLSESDAAGLLCFRKGPYTSSPQIVNLLMQRER